MNGVQHPVSDAQHPPQGYRQRPAHRSHFDIAIVCALPLEYDAVTLLVDEFWDETGDSYGRAVGDGNNYRTGRIGSHHVVIVLLPGMGKVCAAIAVARLRASYSNIKLVLLVGICGGVPSAGGSNEILLGDVIISETVVQYDYGRRYPDSFATKTAIGEGSSRSSTDVRGLLAFLRSEEGLGRLQQRTSYFLHTLQQHAVQTRRSHYNYPGASFDKLFEPKYRHRHHNSGFCICSQWKELSDSVCQEASSVPCSETQCENGNLVRRERLERRLALEKQNDVTAIQIQSPLIFVGRIASGDTVMKSGKDRDRIAKEQNVIAFEMEGAGFWEELPCLVVKGVCDYADSHKDKSWQPFAAAAAAATMKALLEMYVRTDTQRSHSSLEGSKVETVKSWETGFPKLASSSIFHQNKPWRHVIVEGAVKHLPKMARDSLGALSVPDVVSKHWNTELSKFINSLPDTPSWLCHTAPYERFVSEVENIIWYQATYTAFDISVDLERESEDIPLSLLGDLDKREVKFRAEEIARAREMDRTLRDTEAVNPATVKNWEPITIPKAAHETTGLGLPMISGPKVSGLKRSYLFYTPREESENHELSGMSPLQSFLWSLVSQALLWKDSSMDLLLQLNGVVNPQTSRLYRIPEVNELKAFLRTLIKINGNPVIITACRTDRLLHEIGSEPIEFLVSLCNNTATLGVRVFLILSTSGRLSTLPGIKSSQTLNRYTECDECLGNLRFDAQFLRRDEVSTADPGTNTWIWNHPSFIAWQQKPSGVLWIEGKAGSGKSILAKTIRTRLSESSGSDGRGLPLPQISDWFYSTRHGSTTRSHVSFLRSILSQFLQQNKDAFHAYAAVYREKKNQSQNWEFEDYENILVALAAQGMRAICIVDAMDESEDGEGTFLLRRRVIALMARLVDSPASQIRFLVLSRYTADIDRILHQLWKEGDSLSHLVLERENADDVALLVDNGLAALKEAMSAFESDTEDEVEDPHFFSRRVRNTQDEDHQAFKRMRIFLLEHTQGVILWIKLTIEVLIGRVRRAFYNTQELEADLRSLPMNLANFYSLILRDLQRRYPEGLEKTRRVLMWVVGASVIRPLALEELYEAMSIPLEIEPELGLYNEDPMVCGQLGIRAKSWIGFYRQLRVRCGPFVEIIVPQKHDQNFRFSENTEVSPQFTIQLLHRTVKDFLQDMRASGPLSFSEQEAALLVRGSLERYVQFALPVGPSNYCPIPAKQESGSAFQGPAIAMAEYLDRKRLLEFALSTMPEEKWLHRLDIFEKSVCPPLMAQRGHLLWNQTLRDICLHYLTHVCNKGLTTAVANLLTIASNLILSWPTSLRYGPLASAIKECTLSMGSLESLADNPSKREAVSMIRAFTRTEQSLVWECGGVQYGFSPNVKIPDRETLADSITEFEVAHGRTRVNKAKPKPRKRTLSNRAQARIRTGQINTHNNSIIIRRKLAPSHLPILSPAITHVEQAESSSHELLGLLRSAGLSEESPF